jgi:hypothetical protein
MALLAGSVLSGEGKAAGDISAIPAEPKVASRPSAMAEMALCEAREVSPGHVVCGSLSFRQICETGFVRQDDGSTRMGFTCLWRLDR